MKGIKKEGSPLYSKFDAWYGIIHSTTILSQMHAKTWE